MSFWDRLFCIQTHPVSFKVQAPFLAQTGYYYWLLLPATERIITQILAMTWALFSFYLQVGKLRLQDIE